MACLKLLLFTILYVFLQVSVLLAMEKMAGGERGSPGDPEGLGEYDDGATPAEHPEATMRPPRGYGVHCRHRPTQRGRLQPLTPTQHTIGAGDHPLVLPKLLNSYPLSFLHRFILVQNLA
jgi:hypothetical protein